MAKQKHTAKSMRSDLHCILARAMEVSLHGDLLDREVFCCHIIGYLHRHWSGSENIPLLDSAEFAAQSAAFIADAQAKYFYSPMRPPRSQAVGAEQAGEANKKEAL